MSESLLNLQEYWDEYGSIQLDKEGKRILQEQKDRITEKR